MFRNLPEYIAENAFTCQKLSKTFAPKFAKSGRNRKNLPYFDNLARFSTLMYFDSLLVICTFILEFPKIRSQQDEDQRISRQAPHRQGRTK
jgi:hypothetical protein